MKERVSKFRVTSLLCIAGASALAMTATSRVHSPAETQTKRLSAIERMQQPGPEDSRLSRRTGLWDVTMTLRLTPDADPVTSGGIIAERQMVGQYLEEVMKPASESRQPDFRRVSYLYYSRVEGRWQYVSIDTRFPVGVMPAWSFRKATDRTIFLEFENLAFVGFGPEVEGRMVHSNLVITDESESHDTIQQHWTQADGTGREWLAVQYEYRRRK